MVESADKVIIYHIEGRRSQRVIWLCEELGKVQARPAYQRAFKVGAPDGLDKFNPKKK